MSPLVAHTNTGGPGRSGVIALTLSERPGIRNGICGRVVLTGKTMAMVEPASAEGVVRDFMAACKAAWPTGNATTLARFFSDEAEYRNGPLNPVKGRAAIAASLAAMMGMGGEVDADIRHLVADGPVVVTERVDYWKSGDRSTWCEGIPIGALSR